MHKKKPGWWIVAKMKKRGVYTYRKGSKSVTVRDRGPVPYQFKTKASMKRFFKIANGRRK